jgi:copper oxidase (laccase) domain-containing protein
VLLCVTVADCIPVFLVHPATRTVGLLHAGWRGTAAGILEGGIEAVARLAMCRVQDVVMHCGVGICGSCYEVGHEVIKALRGSASPNHDHIDLRAELAARAGRAGLTHVTASGWCTAHDGTRFFSHRRSGGSEGRMVAYVGVPAA